MAALKTATAGLDMIAPGAGQAAQTGIQMINRTIQFAGQAAAIGASGLLETFSLSGGSGLSDPMKTLPGRLLAGFSGARPASPNTAGQNQQPNNGQQQSQGGQPGQSQGGGPLMHIENMNVDSKKGGAAFAGDAAQQFKGFEAAGGVR